MRVVRLKPYLRAMWRMGLGDIDMQRIEMDILAAPQRHPMIQGLKGVRKARFARPGAGKRGGGRVIYFLAISRESLFMLTAYPKSERDDLSPAQRKSILQAIDSIARGRP